MCRWRRPVCGRYGHAVVMSLCTWEVVALLPRARIPTLSTVVRRRPVVGVLLLAGLTHHWFVERNLP